MVDRKVSEPVQDALRAYFELAMGLTEASRKKAEKTVKKLAKEVMGKGQATAGQLQTMADDLIATSAANREAVARLVRVEMDRALSRVGLATTEEVATLTARIDALERQLRDQAAERTTETATATKEVAPAKKTAVVKKAPVVKTAPIAKKTADRVAKAAAEADVPMATPRKTAAKAPVKAPAKTVAKAPAKKAVKKAVRATGATP